MHNCAKKKTDFFVFFNKSNYICSPLQTEVFGKNIKNILRGGAVGSSLGS